MAIQELQREPIFFGRLSREALGPRMIGVQGIIINPADGNIWVHDDGDGQKTESHVEDHRVLFLNTRETRRNAVSGGLKPLEDGSPVETLLREMRKELKYPRIGQGMFALLDGLPLVADFQGRDGQQEAFLLGCYFVVYMATPEEVLQLQRIGEFKPPEEVLAEARTGTDTHRPMFSFALEVITGGSAESLAEQIQLHNDLVVSASIQHAQNYGLRLQQGVFADAITS